MKHYSMLCLGDSYTIGEGLPLHESFPYQLLQSLRKEKIHFYAPEIVAKTGWTTFELEEHLLHHELNEHYDFVTLLIGVNNQYRGLGLSSFREEFDFLIQKALHFANQLNRQVFVISIPDWGVTPFARDRDTKLIASDIDDYNNICATMAAGYNVHYIDITISQRIDGANDAFLAGDQLHPSAGEYAKWAGLLFNCIRDQIAS